MPRKKSKKTIVKSTKTVKASKKSSNFQLSKINLHDSYVSLFLGIIVVVIIAILLFVFLVVRRSHPFDNLNSMRTQLQQQLNQQAAKPTKTPTKVTSNNQMGTTYVVVSGDSLWTIAQREYNDGGRWVDIARINNISNPDVLFAGTRLSLPNNIAAFAPKTYTVKDGDSLWTIALNEYGDGYRWVDIATANNLSNPNWIWAGTTLILPM